MHFAANSNLWFVHLSITFWITRLLFTLGSHDNNRAFILSFVDNIYHIGLFCLNSIRHNSQFIGCTLCRIPHLTWMCFGCHSRYVTFMIIHANIFQWVQIFVCVTTCRVVVSLNWGRMFWISMMHICGGYVFNWIGLDVVHLALTIEIVSVIVFICTI